MFRPWIQFGSSEKLNRGYQPPFKTPDQSNAGKTLGLRFNVPIFSTHLQPSDIKPPFPPSHSTPALRCPPTESDENIPPSSSLPTEPIKPPNPTPIHPQVLPCPLPTLPPPSESIVKYYKALYTRKAIGKPKHFEDGFLRYGGNIQLLSSSGSLVIQRPKSDQFLLEISASNKLGLYIVEVGEEVTKEDFVSGKCFIDKPQAKTAELLLIPKLPAPVTDVQRVKEPPPAEAFILDAEAGVFVPPFLSCHLRPHQQLGVLFMFECISGKRGANVSGCILADSMGLGKTLQTITLVYTLVRKDAGPQLLRKVIIATPKTLIMNWKNEFLKWVGSTRLLPLVCLGSKKDKEKSLRLFSSSPLPVLLISYETLKRHVAVLGRCCDLLICDEGHRLKNLSIDTTKSLNLMPCVRRILLTGTPLQNNLKEFFSCMSFANPALIDSWEKFNNVFAQPIVRAQDPSAPEDVRELGFRRNEQLQALTGSFILRRTGEILHNLLPPRHEYLVFLHLTEKQEILYLKCLQSQYAQGVCQGSMSGALSLLAILRKLVNHPCLLQSRSKVDSEVAPLVAQVLSDLKGSKIDLDVSTKFRFLESLLKFSIEVGDKVLIVSSFTSTLVALESLCGSLDIPCVKLDGDTSDKRRQEYVTRFNTKPDEKVFLLSTKAGGCGLNLVGANRMVLFDADWNPSSDKQAMGRVWRDGQTKPVFIYRLFCSGTLEEKIHQLQANKEGLFASVVDSKKALSHFSKDNLKEVFTYSRKCQTYEASDDIDGAGFAGSFLREMRGLVEVVKEKKEEWQADVKEERLDFSTAVEDDTLKRKVEEESEEEDDDGKRVKVTTAK